MLHTDQHQRITFNFEGQFLGLAEQAGKLNHLRLKLLSEEMPIKLPKQLRIFVRSSIQPGEPILVSGIAKFDCQTQRLKLKATQITPLAPRCPFPQPATPASAAPPPPLTAQGKPKLKVLVCQKSGCLKKGAKGLCEALEKNLCDHNLNHHVVIQPTGCLKQCSTAPNLMLMPGKTRYPNARLKTLPQLTEVISQCLQSKPIEPPS
jgi:(2Fe-2S) ferredoxin